MDTGGSEGSGIFRQGKTYRAESCGGVGEAPSCVIAPGIGFASGLIARAAISPMGDAVKLLTSSLQGKIWQGVFWHSVFDDRQTLFLKWNHGTETGSGKVWACSGAIPDAEEEAEAYRGSESVQRRDAAC